MIHNFTSSLNTHDDDDDDDDDDDGDDGDDDDDVKTMYDLINSVRMCPVSPTISGDVKDMIMTHPLLICYIVFALNAD